MSPAIHPYFARAIGACVDVGVQCVMLPMVRSVADARAGCEAVRGRAESVRMVEHADPLRFSCSTSW